MFASAGAVTHATRAPPPASPPRVAFARRILSSYRPSRDGSTRIRSAAASRGGGGSPGVPRAAAAAASDDPPRGSSSSPVAPRSAGREPRPAAAEREEEETSTPSSSSPAPPHPGTKAKPPMSPLAYVNESTKFVVAGAALATLVTHPNVPVAWCLIGSVVNSIAGKLLKRLLNHARPTGAAKADPGMPSSHAVSLAYLSTYAAAGLLQRGGGIETNPTAWPVPVWAVPLIAAGLVSTGMFFTWLRVALGYHTWPQVLAGYAMGAANALAWFAASIFAVEPTAAASPSVRVAVYAGVGATSALFGRLAWRWVEETKEWARWRKKRAKRAE